MKRPWQKRWHDWTRRFHRGRSTERLIVFARAAEPGRAKTRLIPALGAEGAARLQDRMTAHTLRWADELRAARGTDVEVRYTGGPRATMQQRFGSSRRYEPQAEGDLGQRMLDAFEAARRDGVERAILVGTDCPGMTGELAAEALDALREHDLVLGPACDGGYYLIGLRRPLRELFDGMAWSTESVLAETLSRAKGLGWSTHLLVELSDVDRPEDLAVWEEIERRAMSPPTTQRLSVIIPALNEAAQLGDTLAALRDADDVEVIVVDGGSRDETCEVAAGAGARVLAAPRGRARQMNIGAAAATGELLLFLHADTHLPAGFERAVREAAAREGFVAGAFRLEIEGAGPSLRWVARMANLRSRWLRLPYGDQAIFLRRELFRVLGGFPEMPLMEDFELMRRLRRLGTIVLLPLAVQTSSRRWRKLGVWRTTLINQAIVLAYLLGVSPSRLAEWYRRRK